MSAAPTLVDRLLADPPVVHAMAEGAGAELGLWSTDRDCYLLLAESVGPGALTLETGSGLSTVLFTAAGARHHCVTPSREEAERIIGYCEAHGISVDRLRFEIGASDEVLPRLPEHVRFDVVLIDGNHGFPVPMIDWYYAGSRLKPGGLLVLDDVALPAVAYLCSFIDRDPRFTLHRRTAKWVAYRAVTGGSLRQDWFEQRFYTSPAPAGIAAFARRAWGKLERELRGRTARVDGP